MFFKNEKPRRRLVSWVSEDVIARAKSFKYIFLDKNIFTNVYI